eukprot:TRINITY_DN10868_c0_g1_i1.p1 TRINITY_DN10868_c0_g1~~TRINITY_DN10868_c0_g1_i1.p1  ORF type:complete len:461 (+),score=15.67 TRINITY_DN10868_c0_g1_i1:128-1510(+)
MRRSLANIAESCGQSSQPSDLPVCEYDCGLPTSCLQTGRCQCLNHGRCSTERRPYLLSELIAEHTDIFTQDKLHLTLRSPKERSTPKPTKGTTTTTKTIRAAPVMVNSDDKKKEGERRRHGRLVPRSLLYYILTPPGLALTTPHGPLYPATAIVPDLSNGSNIFMNPISRGRKANAGRPCFYATELLLKSIDKIAVAESSAKAWTVQFYHGCHTDNDVRTFTRAALNYTDAQPEDQRSLPLIWIAVHDWSKCMTFAMDTKLLRDRKADRLHGDLPKRPIYFLQTNGDSQTNCYHYDTDVVIPPSTCLMDKLVNVLPSEVMPMSKRFRHIFFAGGMHRFRRKLVCPDVYEPPATKNPSSHRPYLLMDRSNPDYLKTLNNTRYCLLPMGTTGWSTRQNDAISFGCIPVFVSDYTFYPFQDLVDYSFFSVFIRQGDIPLLQETIESLSLQVTPIGRLLHCTGS